MAGRSSVTIEPKYRFTGKEKSEATGQYLFGARTYNPLIGKWDQVDTMESEYMEYSPYNYALNNSPRFIDPYGISIWDWIKNIFKSDVDFTVEYKTDIGVVTAKAPEEQPKSKPDAGQMYALQWYLARESLGNNPGLWNFIKLVRVETQLMPNVGIIKTGTSAVYFAKAGKEVIYVGITNNLARRTAEDLAKRGFNIDPLIMNLSRSDLRAVEQALIEIHGLEKNRGTLLNKINIISALNPSYANQIKRGYELLKLIGYR